jgi:hypothetical protein
MVAFQNFYVCGYCLFIYIQEINSCQEEFWIFYMRESHFIGAGEVVKVVFTNSEKSENPTVSSSSSTPLEECFIDQRISTMRTRTTTRTIGALLILRHKDEVSYKRRTGLKSGQFNQNETFAM